MNKDEFLKDAGEVVDEADHIPQLPQSWANHVFYGGVMGLALLVLMAMVPESVVDIYHNDLWALLAVFVVAAIKKVLDHYNEKESWAVCAGKVVFTCLWPASIYLVRFLPN